MRWKALGVGAVIAMASGIAAAQGTWIAPGTATVDGVISPGEWDNANWVHMDQVFYGDPVDLTNAMWAALWDASENAIYLAVTGTDSSHVMQAYADWDQQDGLEIYVNARNDNAENYGAGSTNMFVDAQQYLVGYDTNAASLWMQFGGGSNIPPNTIRASAFGMAGNRLVYEFKIRPFDHYDFYNVANSTEVSLHAGLVIGLDVVMSSRTSAGYFGMLCANTVEMKFYAAANIQTYRLVNPPSHATVILLK